MDAVHQLRGVGTRGGESDTDFLPSCELDYATTYAPGRPRGRGIGTEPDRQVVRNGGHLFENLAVVLPYG